MKVSSIDIVAGRTSMFYLLPTVGLRSLELKDGRIAHMLFIMMLDFHVGVLVSVYND